MAITLFDPFGLQRPFFQPLLENEEWPELTMVEGLNVYEEKGEVVVEASVPGISEDKLEVTYEDGILRIQGKSEEKEEEKKKGRVIHRMQRISSFNYSTYLPRPIDDKKIEAVVQNGVLTIKAPIVEQAKAKRISVTARKK